MKDIVEEKNDNEINWIEVLMQLEELEERLGISSKE